MSMLINPHRFNVTVPSFPIIESISIHQVSPASTAHNFSMPSTVNADDLLLLLMQSAAGSSGNYASHADFTQLRLREDGPAGSSGLYIAYSILGKIADGSEASSLLNFATSAAATAAAHLFRISNWYGDLTDGIAFTNTTIGTGNSNHNSPSLNAPWGSGKTLWIASTASGEDNETAQNFPADTENQNTTPTGTGDNNGGAISSCTRELESASWDPSSFSLSGLEYGVPTTVAIRPAA